MKKLASRQAIQWMIADSKVELQAARLLVYKAAWMADEGKESTTRRSRRSSTPARWPSGSPTRIARNLLDLSARDA